ncbi:MULTISPECIES: GntR family transcriptional regulator [Mesorhizobium]|uniref:GntR family transcriptional regulator n=1 Tax=Mesorhizobium TaxID=68287 RepID=UPI00333D6C48
MSISLLGSATSLHEAIREKLLERIKGGAYRAGSLIPSTTMLSKEFGVSAITVKRALRDLQSLGMLTSITGKGTFVKHNKRFLLELDASMSWLVNAKLRLLSVAREKIAEPAMQTFEPPEAAMLCVRKIVFSGDNSPIMYDAAYLSSDVDGHIVDEFGAGFVTSVLNRHNINITNIRIIIDAAPASGEPAEVFGIPSGYPMLRRLYHITTDKPEMTLYGITESPFDRLGCVFNFPSVPRKAQLSEFVK